MNLYRVNTLVGKHRGCKDVPFKWFRCERGERRPYAHLIENYDPDNKHAEDAIDELFTASEANALKEYLDRDYLDEVTKIEKVALPIPNNSAGVGANATAGGCLRFCKLDKGWKYSLAFRVWGVCDLRGCEPVTMTDDEINRMPWTRELMGHAEFQEWLASRKAAGAAIDIETCELGRWHAYDADPYGARPDLPEEMQQIGSTRWVRSPESRGWVNEEDLPEASGIAMYDRIHREWDALLAEEAAKMTLAEMAALSVKISAAAKKLHLGWDQLTQEQRDARWAELEAMKKPIYAHLCEGRLHEAKRRLLDAVPPTSH
jgi:hypothetical protein